VTVDASKMLALARLATNAGTTDHERASAAARLAALVARDGLPGQPTTGPSIFVEWAAERRAKLDALEDADRWKRIAGLAADEVAKLRQRTLDLAADLAVSRSIKAPRPPRPKPRKGKPAARCVLCNLPRWCETCNRPPVTKPSPKPYDAFDTSRAALLCCSFCGKSQREVVKLIAGPTVYICNECVELCTDIMKEPLPGAEARPT
jgi:hypothetical protein